MNKTELYSLLFNTGLIIFIIGLFGTIGMMGALFLHIIKTPRMVLYPLPILILGITLMAIGYTLDWKEFTEAVIKINTESRSNLRQIKSIVERGKELF